MSEFVLVDGPIIDMIVYYTVTKDGEPVYVNKTHEECINYVLAHASLLDYMSDSNLPFKRVWRMWWDRWVWDLLDYLGNGSTWHDRFGWHLHRLLAKTTGK